MYNIYSIIIIVSIIIGNIISVYFRIRYYKECFEKDITIQEILKYGLFSALSALWIIRLFSFSSIASKVISEEITKTTMSELNQEHTIASDHIITAILSGVAFAIMENVIYLLYLDSSIVLQTSILRIFTNSIIHALFTGSIGYWIYTIAKAEHSIPRRISSFLLFSWLWIMMHYLYNRFLSESYIAFAFIFVIIWYFWLSFFLYKSDRLYLQ